LEKSPAFKLINICNDKFFLPNVSHTFHARDIFAPVAAHLANGIDVNELGTPDEDYFKIRIPGIEKGKNFLKVKWFMLIGLEILLQTFQKNQYLLITRI